MKDEVLFTPTFYKFDFYGQHTALLSIKTTSTQLTVTDALIPTFIFNYVKNYLKFAHFQAIFIFSVVRLFYVIILCSRKLMEKIWGFLEKQQQ